MTPEVFQGRVLFDPRRGVLRVMEAVARRIKNGGRVWDAGLGDVMKAAIEQSEIPGPMTAADIVKDLGILPKQRRPRGTR